MRLVAAVVLLAGCIASSQAHISLNGTAFEYEAPGSFWVAQVGDVRVWEDVAFSADPPIEVHRLGGNVTVGNDPAAITSGPIKVGQTFRFCAPSDQQVTLSVQAGQGHARMVLRMGAC